MSTQAVAESARQRVSLADIARLAAVSAATVSRVLGGQPGPSETTRVAVLQAAAKLGYTPNAIARAMSTSHTRLIGIAVGDLEDPFFTEMLDGAQARARAHGLHLLVASSRRDPRMESALIEDFRGYRVEGIVLAGTPHPDLAAERAIAAALAGLEAAGVPIIQLGVRRGPVPLLRIDFASLAADAARHLLQLGHRRIGYVGSPALEGIREAHSHGLGIALAEAGIALDPALLVAWNDPGSGDAGPVARLVERGVTAILGADDMIAVAVMLALRNLDLAVPGQVSVMGMDGTRLLGQIVRPALSTIALPVKAMGEQAIEEIVRMIDGGAPREVVTLPHALVARETTAPPRDAPAQRARARR